MFFLVPAIVALVAQTTPWHLDRLDQPHGIDHAPYIPPTPHPVPPPILYVLDTGLSTHSLLQNLTLLPGVNFIDDAPTSDCQGHGTHVTALAVGLAGVAQMPVTVIPLKILNCLGIGLCSTTLSALQWFVNPPPPPLQAMTKRLSISRISGYMPDTPFQKQQPSRS